MICEKKSLRTQFATYFGDVGFVNVTYIINYVTMPVTRDGRHTVPRFSLPAVAWTLAFLHMCHTQIHVNEIN
jgi:hypothetical protein